MKKLIFSILAICFLISISLKSQTTTTVCVSSNPSVLSKIDSMADRIGQIHNIGLDAIYDSISANPNLFFQLDKQTALNILNKYVKNYTFARYPSINIDTLSKSINIETSNMIAYRNSHNGSDSLILSNIIDSLYQSGNLSIAGKNCLLQLIYIIDNTISPNNTISLINELIQETENGYKNKSGINKQWEFIVVLSTLYVCKYSTSYWSNNFEKWESIDIQLNSQQHINHMRPNAKTSANKGANNVIKSDGEGAIAGLITMAPAEEASMVFGPGGVAVTVIGSAGGGAIIGSAISIVANITSWFSW